MNKINLITYKSDLTSINAEYLKPILTDYFNIVEYKEGDTFDKQNSLVVIGAFNRDAVWAKKLIDDGIKVVSENFWERDVCTVREYPCLVLLNKNWFWYNESLWYQYLGYHNYKPNKTYSKLAFMPMRMMRSHRTNLLSQLTPYLDNMIYSYVEKGIYLPNDVTPDLSSDPNGNYCHNRSTHGHFQRYFNPEWYDNTYFSVVAESTVDDGDIFVTEKTFKPIAFWHPFVVFGQPGVLQSLKNLGFETFENLFDESYDTISGISKRLATITNCLRNFTQTEYDKLTWDKLEHNRNLFFNKEIVQEKIINEIINPLIDYVNIS